RRSRRDRRRRRTPRVPQGPDPGRAPRRGGAAPSRAPTVPLMADLSAPARLAPTPTAVPPRVAEQPSAMLERFGLLARPLIRLLCRFVHVRPEAVERLRQLARQGTLVYVMRYRSTLDYLLVNAVLVREGLPLARFAPGVSTLAFRPLGDMLRWLVRGR